MANEKVKPEKVKVQFKEKKLDKDGRHTETTVTKMVPAKARKFFDKWGWSEVGFIETDSETEEQPVKPKGIPKTN
jgi:hypothetical protein